MTESSSDHLKALIEQVVAESEKKFGDRVLDEMRQFLSQLVILRNPEPTQPWEALHDAVKRRRVSRKRLLSEIASGELRSQTSRCPGGMKYLLATADLDRLHPVSQNA